MWVRFIRRLVFFQLAHALPALRMQGLRLSEAASLTLGIGGIVALLANRLCVEEVSAFQARSDIISTMACSALLLDAVSRIPTVVRRKESVDQVGETVESTGADSGTRWLWEAVRNCSEDASTMVVIRSDESIVTLGVGPGSSASTVGRSKCRILADALVSSREVYLPDLQVRPAARILSFDNTAWYTPEHRADLAGEGRVRRPPAAHMPGGAHPPSPCAQWRPDDLQSKPCCCHCWLS
jgi:hypothetical protein